MGQKRNEGKRTAGRKTAMLMAAFCVIACMGCSLSEERESGQEAEGWQNRVENVEADAGGEVAENVINVIENGESGENELSETEKGSGESGENELSKAEKETEDSGGEERDISGPKPKIRPADFELTLESEDWGLGFGEPGTQPVGNASPEDLAWYHAYCMGSEEEKVLYLTFDCGYENGNTALILDALKKHNAPGTFFVVGHFLETEPELVKRMVEEGHAVGNHTYHHLDMNTISDKETFQKEMEDVADLFYNITGKELSPYYRPPQGKCNVANLEMAEELGYYTIFWSLAYVDWNQDAQPSHEEAFDKLTTRVHPGAIVLLHNTSNTNGEILDELLTRWEDMGYSFQPLSALVEEE